MTGEEQFLWDQPGGGFAFPLLDAWRELSVQGWLGESTLLPLPKPQQMTTFRPVISLGFAAGQAIHFSTIKGQCACIELWSFCTAVRKQNPGLGRETRPQEQQCFPEPHHGLGRAQRVEGAWSSGQQHAQDRRWNHRHLTLVSRDT